MAKEEEEKNSFPTWGIILIVIGGLEVIALIIVGILFAVYRRVKDQEYAHITGDPNVIYRRFAQPTTESASEEPFNVDDPFSSGNWWGEKTGHQNRGSFWVLSLKRRIDYLLLIK